MKKKAQIVDLIGEGLGAKKREAPEKKKGEKGSKGTGGEVKEGSRSVRKGGKLEPEGTYPERPLLGTKRKKDCGEGESERRVEKQEWIMGKLKKKTAFCCGTNVGRKGGVRCKGA